MTLRCLRPLLLLCTLLSCIQVQASAPAEMHEQAARLGLASQAYWHLLLRYEPSHRGSRLKSEARSPGFFLAANGATNSVAELDALLDALYATPASPDEAAACRFPARTEWLREQLGQDIPHPACPALNEWLTAIRPAQATLIFASDYLNNPSSMFGHTFLRIDASDQTEDTRLLAYAVNYAANANAKNPLSFAWNGLTGGYAGTFSLMPYYQKVHEYSDMENRDLWEYQLALSPAEMQRLVQHLWELRNIEFPYYFLSRNCSYQLLSLLEVARPGLHLRDAFPVQAIPTDTVRRVLAEQGMLRKLVYRPATERRLVLDAQHNSAAVNTAARTLARAPQAPITDELAPADRAAALETAYDYRYYQFMAGDNSPESGRDLRQLLVRRSTLDIPDQRITPPQPGTDPAHGHDTARTRLGLGHDQGDNHVSLQFRPAYHDLLDPVPGYRPGAHIDFLDTEIRIAEQQSRPQLMHLRIVDIDSLTPWDPFFTPWSWFVGFGQRQAAIDDRGHFSSRSSHGVAYVDGGAGGDLRLAPGLECYLQLGLGAEAGRFLDNGWRAGAGPRAGCLYGKASWRLQLQTDSRYYNDTGGMETRSSLKAQFDLDARQGLRLEAGRLEHGGDHANSIEAGWIRYF